MIDTGALTDAVLELIAAGGVLVGDGVAPASGGWDKGQPKVSRFVPYSVTGMAGASVRAYNMGKPSDDWDVSFSLRSFGGSRKQADWAANLARLSITGMIGTRFGDYVVGAVIWQSLGGVSRIDSVDPPYWQISDGFSLACMNDE